MCTWQCWSSTFIAASRRPRGRTSSWPSSSLQNVTSSSNLSTPRCPLALRRALPLALPRALPAFTRALPPALHGALPLALPRGLPPVPPRALPPALHGALPLPRAVQRVAGRVSSKSTTRGVANVTAEKRGCTGRMCATIRALQKACNAFDTPMFCSRRR